MLPLLLESHVMRIRALSWTDAPFRLRGFMCVVGFLKPGPFGVDFSRHVLADKVWRDSNLCRAYGRSDLCLQD